MRHQSKFFATESMWYTKPFSQNTCRKNGEVSNSRFQVNLMWKISSLSFSLEKKKSDGISVFYISMTLYRHCGYRNIVHTTWTSCVMGHENEGRQKENEYEKRFPGWSSSERTPPVAVSDAHYQLALCTM